MEALDLKTQYKFLYSPSAKAPQRVQVPDLQFLRIDGAIEPGEGPGTSPGFDAALSALYGAAYTLKFMFKKRAENALDYPVMALEGLWWVNDGHFDINIKDNWFYTVQILTPAAVTPADFQAALRELERKKPAPANARLRLEHFAEGDCVQMLHLGPYVNEPATIDRMHAYAAANGLAQRGLHHEIYLGDPRRADPAKLKTILRLPVGPA